MSEAQKELEEARDKLAKARKKAETDPNETGDTEEHDEAKEEKKDDEKLAKLVKTEEEASEKVETIQKVIDEAKRYADQPEATRERMVRKVYLGKGEYTIEVELRKNADSQKLTVGGDRKRPEKLDTKKKRKAETDRLLEEYDIAK